MIALITGILRDKTPPTILVETAGGVGFEVWVPMSTFYTLPPAGETVRLLTHQIIRDEEQQLFGFATRAERETFRLLIRVNGVGPRIALALLSHLTPGELKAAVAQQASHPLVKIPGIGKKTAERLLLELKDKLAQLPWGEGEVAVTASPAVSGRDRPAASSAHAADAEAEPVENRAQLVRDVAAALEALGYSSAQIAPVVAALPTELALSDAIRWALRQLAAPKG